MSGGREGRGRQRRERLAGRGRASQQAKGESEEREPTDRSAWHPDSLLPEFTFWSCHGFMDASRLKSWQDERNYTQKMYSAAVNCFSCPNVVCSFTQGTDLIWGGAESKSTMYIQTLLLESGDWNKSTEGQRKITFLCTTNKKLTC